MPQSQKTLEFLQKLKDKGHWNDDYDYSEVEYVNNRIKTIIIDNKECQKLCLLSNFGSPCFPIATPNVSKLITNKIIIAIIFIV